MSSSLYWRPVPSDGEYIGLPPHLMRHLLDDAFGAAIDQWRELDRRAIPMLRGAMIATGDSETSRALNQLIGLIERYGAIEIKEVY